MTHKKTLLAATIAALALIGIPAHAVTIYSQTPVIDTSFASDADPGRNQRISDEFVLAAAATARSVTWRGLWTEGDLVPAFPISFDLTIFNDNAGVPGSVLSNTPVTFNALVDVTDTGANLGFGSNIFEFQADLTPTVLAAGTTYWFSPLTDTTTDDDNWFWAVDARDGQLIAAQLDVAGNSPWETNLTNNSINSGTFYFILDDEPIGGATGNAVPEPISAALGLMGLATLAAATRRRMA